MFKKLTTFIGALLLVAACAHATPTPVVTTLSWDAYTDPKGKGFYIYWKGQGSGTYSNASRSQITDPTKVSTLISALQATAPNTTMCFVMTAFDASNNESQNSNEACGFTGLAAPANERLQ